MGHKFGPLLRGTNFGTHVGPLLSGAFGDTSSAGTSGNLWGHKFGPLPRDRYFLEPLGTQVWAATLGYLWGHKSDRYFWEPLGTQVGLLFLGYLWGNKSGRYFWESFGYTSRASTFGNICMQTRCNSDVNWMRNSCKPGKRQTQIHT